MTVKHADLMVVGAGPGGYAAAFRAADLGRKVVLVDSGTTLGGVCLNEGCIPSKALLHAAELVRSATEMKEWGIGTGKISINLNKIRDQKCSVVKQLTEGLKGIAGRRKVSVINGTATFSGLDSVTIDGEDWTFRNAIIAVGSRPVQLPDWPEDPRIWDSSRALELNQIPKRMTIIGGGIIGLELATVYASFGSKITIVEMASQLLPGPEEKAVDILTRSLNKLGIRILIGTQVTSVTPTKLSIKLSCTGEFTGELKADVVLQSVGRRANGDLINAEVAGVNVLPSGVIEVEKNCQTSNTRIFAAGDVTGAPMLAHRATHQGKVAAEVASGHVSEVLTDLIPAVAYTSPELAWFGLSSSQAKSDSIAHKTTSFPWEASGRNLASGGKSGLTTLVYCPDTNRLLGGTLVGDKAGELIAELVLATEMGARLDDIALTVHAHPTLSETVAFSAERALGTLTDL